MMTDDDGLDEFDLPVVGQGIPAVGSDGPVSQARPNVGPPVVPPPRPPAPPPPRPPDVVERAQVAVEQKLNRAQTAEGSPALGEGTFIMDQSEIATDGDLFDAGFSSAVQSSAPADAGFGAQSGAAVFDPDTTDIMPIDDLAPPSSSPVSSNSPDSVQTGLYDGPPPVQNILDAGDVVAGHTLVELLAEGPRTTCWRAEGPGGVSSTVVALNQGASPREKAQFVSATERMITWASESPIEGCIEIAHLDHSVPAYVSNFSAAGTMADLPMLNWEFEEKLSFIRKLLGHLGAMHDRRIFHGSLHPNNILLDVDLNPVVSEVGIIRMIESFGKDERHGYSPYVPPEIALGEPSRESSDIFSIGRIIYFLLTDETPDEPDEILPLLAHLEEHPPGLVRIVRKCTVRDPAQRYGTCRIVRLDVDKFTDFQNVGIAHPQGKEGAEELARLKENAAAGRAAMPSKPKGDSRGTPPSSKKRETKKPDPPKSTKKSAKRESKKSDYDGADPFTPGQARGGGIAGVVIVVLACGMTHLTLNAGIVFEIMFCLGAGMLTLFAPAFGDREDISRVGMMVVVAGLGYVLNPLGSISDSARRGKLASGSPAERSQMIKAMKNTGWSDFANMDLAEVDLSSEDLSMLAFDGSKLMKASFKGATLDDATFDDADVSDADFRDAKLPMMMQPETIKGWTQAKCNEKTRMPEGWACTDGRPAASVGGDDAEEEKEEELPALD